MTESEVEPIEMGPENPHGNGFKVVERVLATEAEGQRVANPMTARTWKVCNPNVLNPITKKPVVSREKNISFFFFFNYFILFLNYVQEVFCVLLCVIIFF